VSAAEAANIALGVHDEIDDGRIPAIPFSNLQPTRNAGVLAFVTGGAGGVIIQIARRPAALGCSSGYGGRHTVKSGNSSQ